MLRIVLANDAELLLTLERSPVTRQDVELVVACDPVDLLDRVTAEPPRTFTLCTASVPATSDRMPGRSGVTIVTRSIAAAGSSPATRRASDRIAGS